MIKWNCVFDIMPPSFEQVLCYGKQQTDLADYQKVDLAYLDDDRKWNFYHGTDGDGWRITHWAALTLPEDE